MLYFSFCSFCMNYISLLHVFFSLYLPLIFPHSFVYISWASLTVFRVLGTLPLLLSCLCLLSLFGFPSLSTHFPSLIFCHSFLTWLPFVACFPSRVFFPFFHVLTTISAASHPSLTCLFPLKCFPFLVHSLSHILLLTEVLSCFHSSSSTKTHSFSLSCTLFLLFFLSCFPFLASSPFLACFLSHACFYFLHMLFAIFQMVFLALSCTLFSYLPMQPPSLF